MWKKNPLVHYEAKLYTYIDVSILYNYTCGQRLSLYTVYQFTLHLSKGNRVKSALFLHLFEICAYRDPAAN